MIEDRIVNKIIKAKCKEIFPKDVFQKGTSRIYYDDNGYYLTQIEFQPYSLRKGTFLNVGLSFLFHKEECLSYNFCYDKDIRIGRKFIEFKDEIQFERDIAEYVELANEYILKYREFRDIQYTKDYITNHLDDCNWNPYYKSMLCFLTDDIVQGQKYYQMFLEEPFFKTIIEKYDYPRTIEDLDKKYVWTMIKNQREFWHSKNAMKRMKNYPEWEW